MKQRPLRNVANGTTRWDFLKRSAGVVVGSHTLSPWMYGQSQQPSVAIVTGGSDLR